MLLNVKLERRKTLMLNGGVFIYLIYAVKVISLQYNREEILLIDFRYILPKVLLASESLSLFLASRMP